MSVRAKFAVQRIERSRWAGGKEVQTIVMTAVYDGSEENKKFFAATPSGQISLGTVNEEAAKYFDLGGEYYADFTKVEPPAQFEPEVVAEAPQS